jgi:hypothetical protein
MYSRTKLVDKLEAVDKFHIWKYRVTLILEENEFSIFIKENVPKLADATIKAKYQKDMLRAKRIIADSIKDDLISKVYSNNNTK